MSYTYLIKQNFKNSLYRRLINAKEFYILKSHIKFSSNLMTRVENSYYIYGL